MRLPRENDSLFFLPFRNVTGKPREKIIFYHESCNFCMNTARHGLKKLRERCIIVVKRRERGGDSYN